MHMNASPAYTYVAPPAYAYAYALAFALALALALAFAYTYACVDTFALARGSPSVAGSSSYAYSG